VVISKDNTGLTHLGAREYDPTTGRFITVDPIMDLTDPQQWNAYGYANNNPTTFSDPSGLKSWDSEEGRYENTPLPPPKPTEMKILPGGTVISTITEGEGRGKICFDFNVCGYGDGGSDIHDHNALIAEYDRLKATGEYELSLVGSLYMLHITCGNTGACGSGWANDIHYAYLYMLDIEKPDSFVEKAGEALAVALAVVVPLALSRYFSYTRCRGCPGEVVAGSGVNRSRIDATRADQIWADLGYGTRGAFGKDVWGRGEAGAREFARTMTRGRLEEIGLTGEHALIWRDFYGAEFARNPKNGTARERALLMQRYMDLLS
jgi:RHS repeat-associated protein